MTKWKKYKHKQSGEIVEAKLFCVDTARSILYQNIKNNHYCVYSLESSGENIWGQDYTEEDFLKQYELIS